MGIDGKFKKPKIIGKSKNNTNLVLWFEEFVKNPKIYIQKIVNYLELDHVDIDKIYLKFFLKTKKLDSI